MRRRNHIITIAAVAASALPASQAMAMPDGISPVAGDRAVAQQTERAPKAGTQGYHSADALDAAKARGIYATESTPQPLERQYGSPDALDAGRELPHGQNLPTVEIRDVPSSGFDWGDAGIGAAGVLALFGIAAGSTLLLTSKRRRRFQVVTH